MAWTIIIVELIDELPVVVLAQNHMQCVMNDPTCVTDKSLLLVLIEAAPYSLPLPSTSIAIA